MNPKEILDNIESLDINSIEMADINITEIEKERARRNVKDTIKSRENKKNKGSKNSNKKYKQYILAATLAIAILIGISPRVQAEVKKLIFSFNNPGIEVAVDNGYVQNINDVAMSNEDMDIKLENIMIDRSKIALDFLVTFKDKNIIKKANGEPRAIIELYDENDNVISVSGVDGTYGVVGIGNVELEKISDEGNTARLKILLASSEAKIPQINRLKVKINAIMIRDQKDNNRYDKDLNWSFEIDVDDKFKETYKEKTVVEYGYENNNPNIKINKVEVLPTGIFLEYEYFKFGHYENIVTYSDLITDAGKKYDLTSASVGTGDKGQDIVSGVFDGITSFDDIEKFTLEIPTPNESKVIDEFTIEIPAPDRTNIDKVEFIKK